MAPLPHAILIEGGDQDSRMAKAMELLLFHFADDPMAAVKLERGEFEDLTVLEPDEGKKEIRVENIENLISLFKQKPFVSTGKACLIPHGEQLSDIAQNKFLKLLEEPVPGDLILILSENAQGLIETVLSRCMRLWLGYRPLAPGSLSDDIRLLSGALIYKEDKLAEALAALSKYEGSREEALEFLAAFQLFLRCVSVGRFAPELAFDGSDEGRGLKESSARVRQKYADRMRKGVFLAEKTQKDIERGFKIRYALRGMALAMLAN